MKRKYYSLSAGALLCLALTSSGSMLGQTEPDPCGTEVPDGFYEKMQERIKDLREKPLKLKAAAVSTLPVQFIIGRNDDGTSPALSSTQKQNVMNELNGAYADMDMAFYEAASELYIDNTTWNTQWDKADDNLLPSYEVANVINIFVFKSIKSGSSSICGYAKFPNGGVNDNRVVIQTSCSQNGSTTAHELGHYFSIFHTHQGGNELVNGSNCTYAGDLFCDTPADPNISGLVNSSCVYTGTATDANGDPYAPNPNNIMSYSLKSCRTYWSPEQQNAIVASLNSDRDYLLDGAIIATFPYTEGFESGTGGWTNSTGDDINWTRDANGTTSSSTGPSSGQSSTWYMYTEASSPNYPSKVADFISPGIDLDPLNNPVLEFGYHMYGSAMGSMEVSVSNNGGSSWTSLWSESGNLGNVWNTAELSLADYHGQQILIRFRGTTGTSYTSDMAIDNVSIRESDDNTSVINTFPYIEGFETGLGVWSNDGSDDIDWTRDAGGTTSSATGPSDGQSGDYYMYTEASSPNYPSKVANLLSPDVYLTDLTDSELEFGYHMYGSAMGTLKVFVSTNGGSSWIQEWSQSGNLGNSWNTALVDLSSYDGQTIRIRFEGTTGTSYTSDMAIDNITIDGTDGSDEAENTVTSSLVQSPSELMLYPNPVEGNLVNLKVN
ncbi:MAG: choice-of-anchor J domain-containing protein, partial [Owenweeksia sp.]